MGSPVLQGNLKLAARRFYVQDMEPHRVRLALLVNEPTCAIGSPDLPAAPSEVL